LSGLRFDLTEPAALSGKKTSEGPCVNFERDQFGETAFGRPGRRRAGTIRGERPFLRELHVPEGPVSTPSSTDREPQSGPSFGARIQRLRARAAGGVRDTFADRARRWRLIRTISVWAVFAAAVAVFFAIFTWDWFRGPLARYLSARTGREVQIEGHLQVHPFSWRPWAQVGGVRIGNPKWLGGGRADVADLGQTTIQAKLIPLLTGRLELPLVDIEQPTLTLYADKSGRNNWTFGKPSGQGAKLPLIQHFVLNQGKVRLEDVQRRLRFVGTVTTTENAGRFSAQAFHLEGAGALNAAPFVARVVGGPLVHVQRDRPYPFDMDVHAGATHIVAHGQVTKPFDLGHLTTVATVTGPDLADLYLLTGVVLPNTPAYSLHGDVVRDGTTYKVTHFAGRVGRSDLSGVLTLEKQHDRRFLKGDLRSRTLDMTDLGALFGGPQAGKSPTEETAASRAKAATGHILPDAPLDVGRVRSMDADVRYRAQSVIASKRLPLRAVGLHLTLDQGVLNLNPVTFTMPHGVVGGHVRLDARGPVPISRVDFQVSNMRIEDVVPRFQGASPIDGPLQARAALTGAGDTVHKAAASSNGRVMVAIPGGTMRKSLAEMMGVNVVPGLFELLSKDPKQTPVRCAVVDFNVSHGVMSVRRFVLDTGVVLADGSGTVNLGSETMNLKVQGHTKKPRLVRVIAPFDVTGSLNRPRMKIEAGPAIAQGAAAVGLGALLSPLAAILPFVAPGGAHDANCAALLTEARSAGAPVTASHIAAAGTAPAH
jgi:uncharacterized protein involved in outer membrane biogenesis